MPIVVTLDAVLARRNITARELAGRIGISETHVAVRSGQGPRHPLFDPCADMRCAALPSGDLLDYRPEQASGNVSSRRDAA
jgi:Predicted transcriptional regulator